MQIVIITWFDSTWYAQEKTIDSPMDCMFSKTVGLLIKQDDVSVSVAQDYFCEENVYRRIQTIPLVNIVEMRAIEENKITMNWMVSGRKASQSLCKLNKRYLQWKKENDEKNRKNDRY